MTGGHDEAANLIDTSETGPPIGWRIKSVGDDGSVLCEAPTGHVRRYIFFPTESVAARLHLCRELLETAVDAWESCVGNEHRGGWRAARLTVDWYVKSKEALGER